MSIDALLQVNADLFPQHIPNDGDSFGGGHPVSALKLARNPLIGQSPGNLGSTTVDHNRFHPHRGEKDHVIGKGLQEIAIHHGVSAQLDHKDAALESPNPGQSLGQSSRFEESLRVGVRCRVHG